MLPRRKIHRNLGIEIMDNYTYFMFTSPSKECVEAVVTGLLSHSQLRVGNIEFLIEQVEILPTKPGLARVHFKTLSPTVVSRKNAFGKKEYVLPTEKDWSVSGKKILR